MKQKLISVIRLKISMLARENATRKCRQFPDFSMLEITFPISNLIVANTSHSPILLNVLIQLTRKKNKVQKLMVVITANY